MITQMNCGTEETFGLLLYFTLDVHVTYMKKISRNMHAVTHAFMLKYMHVACNIQGFPMVFMNATHTFYV